MAFHGRNIAGTGKLQTPCGEAQSGRCRGGCQCCGREAGALQQHEVQAWLVGPGWHFEGLLGKQGCFLDVRRVLRVASAWMFLNV